MADPADRVIYGLHRKFKGVKLLEFPLILVNFKTYENATGKNAVKLARIISEVAHKYGINAAVAPQHVDIYRVSREVGIPVLSQHVDPISPGRNTGWISPFSIKESGAVGSIVNHSEHPLPLQDISGAIEKLRELKMTSVVCAKDIEISKQISSFDPDIIAIEPPELIATGRAVSKVSPEIVSKAVESVHEVNPSVVVLCGAGISSGEDVRIALELGAEGVLVASGVVQAKDQRAAMEDLAKGIKK